MKLKIKDKRAFTWDEMGRWILAVLVLLVVVVAIVFILEPKGFNLIDKIFEIIRFGRE